MTEESLFIEALEVGDAAERAAFLGRACAGDAGLRGRLEQLLERHARVGSFLGRPAIASPATGTYLPGDRETQSFEVTDSGIGIGSVIGPYKLLQKIGEGGMGSVYMAEQTHPVRRKVALKVIKPGMDSRQVIARFEAERQALAMMDHVNIARVFDGGTTEAGRPYFVMELVHGVPITQYCDEHHLTPRQRLELFVPVCHAIQHAHQKGVIHRDVKPSNVMVTLYDGRPVPKVIDFGVAKATEQKLTDRTLFTQYGTMVGTFEYMSPEQAEMSALGVDTRSDIYSLGVLLYELLTGGTPLSGRRVREAAHAELLRMIKEEEPPRPSTRLSASGEALASISACRKTEPAKLSQLMRGELDWIVMKTLEKDRARRYETANGLAADVMRYLNDEPVQACPPSATYRFRKFARRNKVVLLTMACVFVALVTVAGSVGWIVRDRGAREAALDSMANRSLDEAAALIEDGRCREALLAVQRTETVLKAGGREVLPVRLLELQRDLAIAQRLEDIYSRPEGEEFYSGHALDAAYAESFAEVGIDVARPIADIAESIRARGIWRELVRALDVWAGMRQRSNNRAEPSWQRLLEIAEAADPDLWRASLRQARRRNDGTALRNLAMSADVARIRPESLHLLGVALYDNGARPEAMALLRLAQIRYPADWWINNILGWYCLTDQEPLHDDALRFYTAAQAVRPENPHNLIGIHSAFLGKKAYAEAVQASSRAIELRPDDAMMFGRRGFAYSASGHHESAIADFTRAIELDSKMAWVWANRGVCYNRMQQWDKAIADYSNSLELDPKSALAWTGRGMAHGGLGHTEQELRDYGKAIELDPKYATAWSNRGAAYSRMGDFAQALADLDEAIRLDPRSSGAWCNRGNVFNRLGQWERATAEATKAIEFEPKLVRAWFNRGLSYEMRGKKDLALADYSKAIEIDPRFMRARNNRGLLYLELGQPAKAVAEFTLALSLDPNYARAWANRGTTHDHLGEADLAIADFNKAIELDPTNQSNWKNRGLVHQKAGRWELAFRDRSQAFTLELGVGEARAAKAVAQVLVGRYAQAIASVRFVVAFVPEFAKSCNELAWLLAACPDPAFRDPSRAVELAERATRLLPANGDYHHTLGIARYRVGEWKAALATWNKSVELRDGGDATAWFYLAMCCRQLDRPNDARPWFDKASNWMNQFEKEIRKNGPRWAELTQLRDEASKLLELQKAEP